MAADSGWHDTQRAARTTSVHAWPLAAIPTIVLIDVPEYERVFGVLAYLAAPTMRFARISS
jgi:hypothetical protein